MSIFNQSFDTDVRQQLELREQILSGKWESNSNNDVLYGRSSPYLQYANNKTPFIRLSSGVDVVNPHLKKYFNISENNNLAERFVLEGGTRDITNDNNQKDIFNAVYKNDWNNGDNDDLGFRPMAGISGMSVKSHGDKIATLRIATVNIECYTLQQLEALELLYMRPGYRVLLEWGHTIYFNDINSITPQPTLERIDIIKSDGLKNKREIFNKINSNQKNTEYNYDAMIGEVRNFSWEVQGDGSYKCLAEIISLGYIIDSLRMAALPAGKSNTIDDPTKTIQYDNIIKIRLNAIKKLLFPQQPSPPSNVGSPSPAALASSGGVFIGRNSSSQPTPISSVFNSFTLSSNVIYKEIPSIILNSNTQSFDIKGCYIPTNSTEKANLVYIRLIDLVNIINQDWMFMEGKEGIMNIKTPLNQCRSHPYQISVDPYCCLIEPFLDFIITSYDNFLDNELASNFPYRLDTNKTSQPGNLFKKNDPFKGDMENILVEIDHVIGILNSLENKDNESEGYNQIFIKDFLHSLMSDIASSTGYINDFRIIISPEDDSKIEIIDFNTVEGNMGENYYTIPVMGIGNHTTPSPDGTQKGGTYVRSYRMSTQLTNNIATIVSVGSQYDIPNVGGVDGSIFNSFNQGIKDRLKEPFADPHSENIAEEILTQANPDNIYIQSLKQLSQKIGSKILLTPSEASSLKSILRDYITQSNKSNVYSNQGSTLLKYNSNSYQFNQNNSNGELVLSTPLITNADFIREISNPPLGNFIFSTYTPVPLKLSITMDGISGIKVGNIFKLPADRLPFQYKVMDEGYYGNGTQGQPRVGFIVFGINHNVSKNGGWVTELDCQMIMLQPETINDITKDMMKFDFQPTKDPTSPSSNSNIYVPDYSVIQPGKI